MDPNSNIQEQPEIARRIQARIDRCDDDTAEDADDGNRLAELVLALDGWMRSGGFAPVRWGVR